MEQNSSKPERMDMVSNIDDGLQSTVDELEARVDNLTTELALLAKTVAEIRAVGEDFWREEAAVLLLGAAVESWHYHVRSENVLFADVFPCEVFGKDGAKRWVGRSGEIFATLALNRAAALLFSARIDGFSIEGLEATLRLEIDGETIPWTSIEGQVWSALVPMRRGHARLQFRLYVNAVLLPPEKDVTFAFSELRIVPLPSFEEGAVRATVSTGVPLVESGESA